MPERRSQEYVAYEPSATADEQLHALFLALVLCSANQILYVGLVLFRCIGLTGRRRLNTEDAGCHLPEYEEFLAFFSCLGASPPF